MRVQRTTRNRAVQKRSATAFARDALAKRPVLAAAGAAAGLLAVSALINHRLAKRAERDNPPSGHFVEVGGVRLHVMERGRGPALVLLHGNGSSIQDFASSGLIDRASGRYRVLAFDRPGYGHSSRPRDKVWNDAAQADLIAGALHRLGIERAVVLGHSWGCSVAISLALMHPRLVAGLVLVSGYFYPSVRADVLFLSAPAVPVLGDVLRYSVSPVLARLLWPLLLRRIFGPQPIPAKFDGFSREMAVRPSQLRAAAAESALMIPDAALRSRHYGELRMPIAIVAGEEDRLVDIDDQSARLHAEVRQSGLRRVAGGGHMLHQTATDQVLQAIDEVTARAEEVSPRKAGSA